MHWWMRLHYTVNMETLEKKRVLRSLVGKGSDMYNIEKGSKVFAKHIECTKEKRKSLLLQ